MTGRALLRGNGSRRLVRIVALLIATTCASASAADDGRGSSAATSAPISRNHSVARASALRSYDDAMDDVVSAPDISASNLVTNDNLRLTIGLHVRGRSSFSEGDVYSFYFDTDSNVATGTDAASGAPPGAEYGIDIAHREAWLLRWNGSSFDPVIPRIPIATVWLDGLGPALQVGREDLGNPHSFQFVFVTTHDDRDFAPDAGRWSYELSPLTLTAGRLSVRRASAGTRVVASMSVERSDFATPLGEGTVGCAARIGRRTLHGRGRFVQKRVACAWRLPSHAGGKRLVGSVQVTFQGVTAKRAFNVPFESSG